MFDLWNSHEIYFCGHAIPHLNPIKTGFLVFLFFWSSGPGGGGGETN